MFHPEFIHEILLGEGNLILYFFSKGGFVIMDLMEDYPIRALQVGYLSHLQGNELQIKYCGVEIMSEKGVHCNPLLDRQSVD